MRSNHGSRLGAAIALALVLGALPSARVAAQDKERSVNVSVGARLTRDDNLFRLPDGVDPAELGGEATRRGDEIGSASVDLAGRWRGSAQEVALDASAASNRFAENEDLDYVSGRASLDWNWRLAERWSGRFGASNDRTLASFANTASLEKDVRDAGAYYGDLRMAFGTGWAVFARGRSVTTTHDNELRQRDDVEQEESSVGLEYRTPRASRIELDFRESRASYAPDSFVGGTGSPSDYDEEGVRVLLDYALTDSVSLETNVGYVRRDYRFSDRGSFSGRVWRAAVKWSPSSAWQLAFDRSHDIKAHLDAESDHFLATGESLSVLWLPLAELRLGLKATREEQHYIGTELLSGPARQDEPLTGAFVLTYAPRDRASFEFAAQREERASTNERFDYAASAVSVAAEIRF